ncbi:hypothetical protein EYR40_004999 [Pleurotus pulmonarius]|nr:hypothetical protein EYR36_006622 [Pleurotus pulmonarius]KAF4601799.1 hypothetical protein EYR40_004999 [Pleurotus pulmonarius]
MTFIGKGIYAKVIGYHSWKDLPDHMWLIEPVEGSNDTFTVRNLASGNYLDLTDGSKTDGASVYCRASAGGNNQKWIIKRDEHQEPRKESLWKMQNEASKRWQGSWTEAESIGRTRQWIFECISQTTSQIRTTLNASPYIQQNFPSFNGDELYLVLSSERLYAIWEGTDLGSTQSRVEIFDSDDFALVFKAEVAKWGNKTFKADGFGILCGMMFSSKADNNGKAISYAYNWSLEVKDPSKVVFFEAHNGKISHEVDGYKAYFGLY